MSFTFDDGVQVHTERLLLRRFYQSDIPDMLKNWISDLDVQRGYGEPSYTNENDVANLLNTWKDQYRWAIILKTTNENIGHVSFCRLYNDIGTAEIEYCVGKAYWGKGIVTEALCAFIQHTFINTPIDKIEAFHRVENPSSGRVLQKSGLLPVNNVTRFSHLPKAPDGDVCYAITREQFVKKAISNH